MLRRARKGPPARYGVRWERALAAPADNGSPLLTDHYLPVTDEPCPTVLIRCPYGRGFPWNYLYGALLAEQGFHVALQSVRGTGGSGGEFDMWRHEAADGQAAVEWLRKQEWFNGELHTMGPSYMTLVQWALAQDPPPEWRSAVLQVGSRAGSLHRFFWAGGVFGLERAMVGGMTLYTQANTPVSFARAVARFALQQRRVERGVPLIDVYPRLYGTRRPIFEDWLTNPAADDPYWAGSFPEPEAHDLAVPASMATGWFDLGLDQVLEDYAELRRAGRDVDLLIGPWTHQSALERGWPEVFTQALARLRGEPRDAPVRVHVGGADEWRDLPEWPPAEAEERHWFLGPETLASAPGDGISTFTYDPRDPTPSIGGPLQSRTGGARDNAVLEKRADVLTFTTEPLTEPVEVLGPVRAEFGAESTAVSADLFARLCDVDPAGRSVNVCDGLARITPGATVVTMSSAAHRFRPGHRIRLQVSGGAHPRFARNYGTGEPLATATRMIATDTIVRHSSILILSVV